MIAFAQGEQIGTDEPPTAVLRRADGGLEELRPSWIISAEGAHSLVRRTLDLPFEGKPVGKQFALGDMQVDGGLEPGELYIFSSNDGFLGMFPLGSGRFRLIASDLPRDGAAPSLAGLQEVFDRRAHLPGRLGELVWSSWFRINSRMVSRLRVGRLLLGGDSAHIHSPAGAQGMNTGLQDMINLGWKLARVMRGEAPESLVDSYEAERLPVIRDVLFGTEKLTDGMASTNPVRRGLIDHVSPWLGAREIVQERATARMSQVAIAYRESPLNARDGTHAALHAGDRLPDVELQRAGADGWSLARSQDVLDPSDFTVLSVSEAGETVPEPPFGKPVAIRPAPTREVISAMCSAHRRWSAGASRWLCRAELSGWGRAQLLGAYAEAHLGVSRRRVGLRRAAE